ncbi:MAG TPA: LysR substrate-binding domain-containing protein [Microbacteriaceae bacterium]|nr:LysR substrate-binding domain-containing protein [Microbacteriaceae bacterium]
MQEIRYTIRQLQHFLAVADTGSISRAVDLTHTSQPGISLSISELERGIGVKLFVRQRAKGMSLTPAGEDFLEYARELLAAAESLQTRMDTEKGSLTGRLAIGCYPTLEPVLLTPLIAEFQLVAPGIALDIQDGTQPELERGLREGSIEVALLYDDHLAADLTSIVIDIVRPYVLLPSDHRLVDDDDVSLIDLADDPMILFDTTPTRHHWESELSRLGIEPRISMRTRNFEFVRCLVGRGLGYGLLMQRPMSNLTYEGIEVVPKRIREPMPTTSVVLAYLTGTPLSPRAQRFVEFTVQERSERLLQTQGAELRLR